MGNENLSSAQTKWLTYLVYLLITIGMCTNGWVVTKAFTLEERKLNRSEFSAAIDSIKKELKEQRDLITKEFTDVRKQIFDLHKESK